MSIVEYVFAEVKRLFNMLERPENFSLDGFKISICVFITNRLKTIAVMLQFPMANMLSIYFIFIICHLFYFFIKPLRIFIIINNTFVGIEFWRMLIIVLLKRHISSGTFLLSNNLPQSKSSLARLIVFTVTFCSSKLTILISNDILF